MMSSYTILIADQSPVVQKIIKLALSEYAFRFIESKTEQDLERTMKRSSIDIVLLDSNFSDNRSGYDLAKFIWDLRPETKVLLMFGNFDYYEDESMQDCGAAGKIFKPFSCEKVIHACTDLIHQAEEEKEDYEPHEYDGDEIEEEGDLPPSEGMLYDPQVPNNLTLENPELNQEVMTNYVAKDLSEDNQEDEELEIPEIESVQENEDDLEEEYESDEDDVIDELVENEDPDDEEDEDEDELEYEEDEEEANEEHDFTSQKSDSLSKQTIDKTQQIDIDSAQDSTVSIDLPTDQLSEDEDEIEDWGSDKTQAKK